MSGLVSAGLLLFRRSSGRLELLVAHPGGPYYARKEDGVWTVPKGLVEPGEEQLDAAKREFAEETGFDVPTGPFLKLGQTQLKSGKRIVVFAAEGDADPSTLRSVEFEIEWPPRSGQVRTFPEVDRARFATPEEAKRLLHSAQQVFVDRLLDALSA